MVEATSLPKVTTSFPGPKSQELLRIRETYVSRGAANTVPIFVREARGAVLEDVDGNVFLDFAGGIGVINVGHCPDEVVAAVKEQVEKYLHLCFHVVMYEPYIRLAEKLVAITPGAYPKKVLLVNSGAEAVENAVKFARKYSGKTGIISLECGFHGRTLLAMSLTSKVKPYKFGFGPFAPDVYKIHSPYCYRCVFNSTYPGCGLHCLEYIERFFKAEFPSENAAAIIVEPVQGEGGFIVCPGDFLVGLRELCRKYGILYIVDEIQTGFGRTGKMFAVEHYGIEPDLMTLAKSIAGGLPLSAVVGRAEIIDAPAPGEVGGTYGGNPVACAAALAAIEKIVKDDLPARAAIIGDIMKRRLTALQDRCPLIGEVRGLGAMVAIELVRDRRTKEPAVEETARAIRECAKNGVVVLKAGVWDNVIRFLVPLVITDEQLHCGLDIIESVLSSLS